MNNFIKIFTNNYKYHVKFVFFEFKFKLFLTQNLIDILDDYSEEFLKEITTVLCDFGLYTGYRKLLVRRVLFYWIKLLDLVPVNLKFIIFQSIDDKL